MNHLSKFSIPLNGIQDGLNEFNFLVDDSFFDSFDHSLIHKGIVRLKVLINRNDEIMHLRFLFSGIIELECDRCLEIFSMPVESEDHLIVKIKEHSEESDLEEVIIISKHDHHLALASHIYDYLSVRLPYRKIHPEKDDGSSGCDPEALKRIENLTRHEENHHDPRWDALKKIKIKK